MVVRAETLGQSSQVSRSERISSFISSSISSISISELEVELTRHGIVASGVM